VADNPALDPELAARIRASVDARITAQIQAARERITQKAATRAAFASNRQHGLKHRNALREAHVRPTHRHDSRESTVTSTSNRKFQIGDQVSAMNDGCPMSGIVTGLDAHEMCATCHCTPLDPDHQGDGSSCCPGPWYTVKLTHDDHDHLYSFAEHELKGDAEMWAEEVAMMGDCLPPAPSDREQLAQETAEYIANVLTPKAEAAHALPGMEVFYTDGRRPPTCVAEIKATLLAGRFWISWTDDRVTAAMRALHGEPFGHSEWIVGDRGPRTAS
jgi:hypothetical protein